MKFNVISDPEGSPPPEPGRVLEWWLREVGGDTVQMMCRKRGQSDKYIIASISPRGHHLVGCVSHSLGLPLDADSQVVHD